MAKPLTVTNVCRAENETHINFNTQIEIDSGETRSLKRKKGFIYLYSCFVLLFMEDIAKQDQIFSNYQGIFTI